MGMLVDGRWREDADNFIRNGRFVRAPSGFDTAIPQDVTDEISRGSGRYLLIASMSCPWSHRPMLVRALLRFETGLPLLTAGGPRVEGYALNPEETKAATGVNNVKHLHQLYTAGTPDFTGRVTVPVLWDTRENRIISNDSAMMMRALGKIASDTDHELVPPELSDAIDELNATIHDRLANAVYQAGFARHQDTYEEAVKNVFSTLDMLENRLSSARYLFDSKITETDLRLFATLVRFDSVYNTHFRCTRKRLVDYPALWAYAREMYQLPGIAKTISFKANQAGYYLNDGDNNPHDILPDLPEVNWLEPHNREQM